MVHWVQAAGWLLPANVCLQLMHPVLESLRNTDKQWLIDTLYAFNGGNVEKFQGFKSAWGQQVMNQHQLNCLTWDLYFITLSFSSAAWSRNTWSQTDAEDPVAVCHGGELEPRKYICFEINHSFSFLLDLTGQCSSDHPPTRDPNCYTACQSE